MSIFTRDQFAPKKGEYRDKYIGSQDNLNIKIAEGEIINSLKKKVRDLNETVGNLTCPKCNKDLLFAWIKETDMFVFNCSTEDCIDIDETEH